MVAFTAELNDLKIIHNALKAINFKEFASIRIMEEGLKITIEEMKSVQTSAYLPKEVFTNYRMAPVEPVPGGEASIEFKISIRTFTDCLNAFGDDGPHGHSMKLIYKEFGAPLTLVLIHSEENIIFDCGLQTMDTDEFAELSLQNECSLNNIVLNSAQFVTVLNELDSTAEIFELSTSDKPPFLKISSIGTQILLCTFEIPKTSEMVVLYNCSTTTSNKYAFSLIKQLIKVIGLSEKVAISTSEQGLLGLQLIIPTEGANNMFIEFYVNALLD